MEKITGKIGECIRFLQRGGIIFLASIILPFYLIFYKINNFILVTKKILAYVA